MKQKDQTFQALWVHFNRNHTNVTRRWNSSFIGLGKIEIQNNTTIKVNNIVWDQIHRPIRKVVAGEQE